MNSEPVASTTLHLQSIDERKKVNVVVVEDLCSLSEVVVNHFITQVSGHWISQVELEEFYVSLSRNAAPYQKRVTLTLSNPSWGAMERFLGITFPSVKAEEPGRNRRAALYRRHTVPSGRFSARLQPALAEEELIELVATTVYERCEYYSNQFLWEAQLHLHLTFPASYFESKPKRGVVKLIEPL